MQLLHVVCVSFGDHACSAGVDRLEEAAWYMRSMRWWWVGMECGMRCRFDGLIGGSLPGTSMVGGNGVWPNEVSV